MCMPKTKVRLDFVVDEEHFKKLIALKNLYSNKTGIEFNMTQALIKTLNDYYHLNLENGDIVLNELDNI